MKLRSRTPRRPSAVVSQDDEDVKQKASTVRRQPRRSVAPRAPPEPPSPPRPRTAPRGGVQKRRSTRPAPSSARTARTLTRARTSATTPSRARRARAKLIDDLLNITEDKDYEVDVVEGEEADDASKDGGGDKQKRVATAKATIHDLPEEVMLGIFSYFRPPQLCWKIGRVCRRWAAWSVSPFLWRGRSHVLSPDPKLGRKNK